MYAPASTHCPTLACKGLWLPYVCEFNDRYAEEYVRKYVNSSWRWDTNTYRGGRAGQG